MNAVVSQVTQLLPAEIVDTAPERLALYSQDVFTIGPPIGAVVRPRCTEEVQTLVAVCRAVSYTHLTLPTNREV